MKSKKSMKSTKKIDGLSKATGGTVTSKKQAKLAKKTKMKNSSKMVVGY